MGKAPQTTYHYYGSLDLRSVKTVAPNLGRGEVAAAPWGTTQVLAPVEAELSGTAQIVSVMAPVDGVGTFAGAAEVHAPAPTPAMWNAAPAPAARSFGVGSLNLGTRRESVLSAG